MDEFLMKEILKNLNFAPSDDEIPFCDLDCTECDTCQEECFDCEFDEEEPVMWGVPDVDYIVFNDPATVVFWADGTKTVVKCMKGEKFEKYAGFMAACMKKMFGSTSRAKAIMEECCYEQPKKEKKPPKRILMHNVIYTSEGDRP